MSKALRWTVAGLLAALVATALVLTLALQRQPAVSRHAEVGPDDLQRAIGLLRAHDPRRARPGRLRSVTLGERDLEVLIDHGSGRWLDAASRVELQQGAAVVTLSVPLPRSPLGGWINLRARWVQTGGLPALDAVRVGRLPVPVWLGEWAALRLIAAADLRGEWQLTADVVRRVQFAPRRLQVVYAWREESAQRVMQALLPEADRQRLHAQAVHLAALAAPVAPGWDASLAGLLGPMLELARQRSAAGGDAAAENRAAIVVLALFANGRQIAAVLPAAADWPRARPLRLLLHGRDDLPRHFLVSAALVVETSGALAQAIGLAKEVADARSGSGFSFKDMAANLAGTRFGEMALRAPAQLQGRAAGGIGDDDLVPPLDGLPEFLPEAEFVRRYGGVGAPAYAAVMADIERRVGALPLWR